MTIWSAEIKELERLYESFKGQQPELEKELKQLIHFDDPNVILLYSRRCLEVIITDLCECELKRPRKTEPLKGIIDKLHKEGKVPSNIITSMDHLNSLSAYGAHPKDFDPEQVKPVLVNLDIIIKWYLKYKDSKNKITGKPEEVKDEALVSDDTAEKIEKSKKRLILLLSGFTLVVAIVMVALFVFNIIGGEKQIDDLEKSIAVLPFKLLSDETDKQYLADGMMEAILLNLSKIGNLRVLGSTSVEQYRSTDKTIETIGKELNVEYIIEGNFQKFGNDAKLIVQLIRTKKESHVWSNEYNRKWDDILAVQSEVAQTVAEELNTVITPEEKMIIETKPTADLSAYDFYLRGNEYLKRGYHEENYRYATQMYQKAVEIDSDFALAWIGLASCSRFLYWLSFDLSNENLKLAKEYLEKAKALSPELKEVQLEEAKYYYHCNRDYISALEIMKKLNSRYPNDDEILIWIGHIYRRLGELKNSLEYNEKAILLNPADWSYWYEAGLTLRVFKEYSKAEDYYKRAFDLNPSNQSLYLEQLELYISTGQIQKAGESLEKYENYINDQDFKRFQAQLEFLGRNYEMALQTTNSLSEYPFSFPRYYLTKHLQLGIIYHTMSDNAMAIKHFVLERNHLVEKIKEAGNDWRLYCSLEIANAFLGMKEEALEAGIKALDILSIDTDAFWGFYPEFHMVKILVILGEYDEAMIRLENIIRHHGFLTVEELKLDPFWDPVRNNQKFKEIISNPAYQLNL